MPRFDVITFDCYGTLIDWETGIRKAFLAGAAAAGVKVPPEEVLPRLRRDRAPGRGGGLSPLPGGPRARRPSGVAERFGWRLDGRDARASSPRACPSWAPFPDTNPALEKLAAAGCRLGILSNVDDDLLAGTRRHFSVAFAPIVTAAPGALLQAGARALPRGARAGFRRARAGFMPRRAISTTSCPCKALGIPVAWINRKGETAGAAGAPDRELPDLAGLAAWVTEES